MERKTLGIGSRPLAATVLLAAVPLVLLALATAQQRSTSGAAGAPLRIDFAGGRSMPPVQPTPAVTANSAGPPVRVDFAGSRSMPAGQPAPATAANSAAPPLRIDFSDTRAMPGPIRK